MHQLIAFLFPPLVRNILLAYLLIIIILLAYCKYDKCFFASACNCEAENWMVLAPFITSTAQSIPARLAFISLTMLHQHGSRRALFDNVAYLVMHL